MNNLLAPIVLFVYNRPWHTRQTLEALSKNFLADKSKLYIYADGPREGSSEEQLQEILEVRKLIREKKWCEKIEIIEHKTNYGIGNSEIAGINDVLNTCERIIVLEDDIITSNYFLKYLNSTLNYYHDKDIVKCISAYAFPITWKTHLPYFMTTGACWGWATWKRSWKNFNSNSVELIKQVNNSGNLTRFNYNNTYDMYSLLKANADAEVFFESNFESRRLSTWNWDICWYASIFLSKGLTLYPPVTLTKNIGVDGSGVHYSTVNKQKLNTSNRLFSENDWEKLTLEMNISENAYSRKQLESYFKKQSSVNLYFKVREKIKNVFYTVCK